MGKKIAVVTGVTGQDGAYLSKFLISKGYTVFGTYRRASTMNFWRLSYLGVLGHPQLNLVPLDLLDLSSVISILKISRPDEIYNLAAQSFVGTSFDQPQLTLQVNTAGVLNLLEAIRLVQPKARFYQASTSEMFGKVAEIPQTEQTPFYPRSPYGVSKLCAHWLTVNYRESYGIFATSGVLFNHESPLRGKEFVTRKISEAVARLKCGENPNLVLGNLDARRDWGFAGEFVEGMWLMLQAKNPDNYILATGETISVRQFVQYAFEAVGIDIKFIGEGLNEKAFDISTGKEVLSVSKEFFRPAEVDLLIGNAEKAKQELNWKSKVSVKEIAKMMVLADMDRILNEKVVF